MTHDVFRTLIDQCDPEERAVFASLVPKMAHQFARHRSGQYQFASPRLALAVEAYVGACASDSLTHMVITRREVEGRQSVAWRNVGYEAAVAAVS